MENRKHEDENSETKREEKGTVLKCPKCGFPFLGPKKTAQECKVRIRKVWFRKPYFYDIPTPERFKISCPFCGKICHVKLQPPASISFLMNYLRRILYRWKKMKKIKSKKNGVKKSQKRIH